MQSTVTLRLKAQAAGGEIPTDVTRAQVVDRYRILLFSVKWYTGVVFSVSLNCHRDSKINNENIIIIDGSHF